MERHNINYFRIRLARALFTILSGLELYLLITVF